VTFLLFALLFALAIATFRDYGVTWDEDSHFKYGMKVLDYYLSVGQDRSFLDFLNLYTYGSAFDLLTAALARISPLGVWETRHLVDALVGIAGIVGTWRIARLLAGPRAGCLAALTLAVTPNYYGHMFNNPKDIPFAVAVIWSVYYILRLVPDLPRPPISTALKLGLTIGLGLGIRVGGLLPLCYLCLALTIWALMVWRREGAVAFLRDSAASLLRVLVPVLGVSIALMLFLWPWTQQDTIGHVWMALREFSHHDYPYKTLFDGVYYPATDLPWSYLPVHILLKLPELTLVSLAAGTVFAGAQLANRRRLPDSTLGWIIVLVAALFPVVFAVVERAVLFDGMRHFLFVLPPLAVIAGAGLDRLFSVLPTAKWRLAGAVTMSGWLAIHLGIMVSLHPDQYVYYNALAGGVPGAAGRFKLDYWAASYREDVNALVAFLKARDKAAFTRTTYHIAVCGPQAPAAVYFPNNFVDEGNWSKADFFISFTKDHCDEALRGRAVYRTERLGTPLSVVRDLHTPQQVM
jgi:hypothetical protein